MSTPTERRGYPLPPWALAESPAEHNGADVLEYLLDLLAGDYGHALDGVALDDDGIRAAEAYLDAWLARHRAAQDTASRCHIEDHDGLKHELADTRAELTDVREQMVDQGLALVDARLAVRDAWRAGYTQRLEDLLGPAGRMPDAEPLLVVVPLTRSAVLTMDPAQVAALAAEAAELALTNRRVELDEDLEDLTLHVCGGECRPGR